MSEPFFKDPYPMKHHPLIRVSSSFKSMHTNASSATNVLCTPSNSIDQLSICDSFDADKGQELMEDEEGIVYEYSVEFSSVPVSVRDEQLKTVATNLCPDLVAPKASTGSSLSSNKKLTVKPLFGGLSNQLFVVENSETSFRVLVRIHPSSASTSSSTFVLDEGPTSKFIDIVDRHVENKLMTWLGQDCDATSSASSISEIPSVATAPKVYGVFLNGRVEEFYDNHLPLSCHDMIYYEREIAILMASLHNRNVPPHVMKKTCAESGDVWERVDSWLEMAVTMTEAVEASAEAVSCDSGESSDECSIENNTQKSDVKFEDDDEAFAFLLSTLKTEWEWLKSTLMLTSQQPSTPKTLQERARSFGSEVVLTHMDVQSLNLLRPAVDDVPRDYEGNKKKNRSYHNLKLIDYEYAGFNPRVMDIANTFCEHCDMNNLCPDYEKEYPQDEAQNEYLCAYMSSAKSISHSLPSWKRLSSDDQQTVLSVLREMIGQYTLVSHLQWAIWSLVKHRGATSAGGYDYLAYAQLRLNGYRLFKKRYFTS